jgi:P27 family predicted phage terminase small subunit
MMGRRGPAPTPTAILKLRGSTLVSKRRQKKEAQGPAGAPDQPDWLDDEARKMWDHLLPMLDGMGVLTRVDGNALARYCRLWSRWRKAEEFIDGKGEMYPLKDDKGSVKCFMQWPQVAIAHKLATQLTRLEQEFGMTPSARSRIPVQGSTRGRHDGKSRYFRDIA